MVVFQGDRLSPLVTSNPVVGDVSREFYILPVQSDRLCLGTGESSGSWQQSVREIWLFQPEDEFDVQGA